MKVYIGKYRNRMECKIFHRYMERKYDLLWEFDNELKKTYMDRVMWGVEWIVQTFVYEPINWIYIDRVKSQRKKIRIDYWDTWNMDYTLSFIILPMLKQFRDNRTGIPIIFDDNDVPDGLKMSDEERDKIINGEIEEKSILRWEYIMGEMIFAFESIMMDNEDEYVGEEYKRREERIDNGLRLFGKYYRALWD